MPSLLGWLELLLLLVVFEEFAALFLAASSAFLASSAFNDSILFLAACTELLAASFTESMLSCGINWFNVLTALSSSLIDEDEFITETEWDIKDISFSLITSKTASFCLFNSSIFFCSSNFLLSKVLRDSSVEAFNSLSSALSLSNFLISLLRESFCSSKLCIRFLSKAVTLAKASILVIKSDKSSDLSKKTTGFIESLLLYIARILFPKTDCFSSISVFKVLTLLSVSFKFSSVSFILALLSSNLAFKSSISLLSFDTWELSEITSLSNCEYFTLFSCIVDFLSFTVSAKTTWVAEILIAIAINADKILFCINYTPLVKLSTT